MHKKELHHVYVGLTEESTYETTCFSFNKVILIHEKKEKISNSTSKWKATEYLAAILSVYLEWKLFSI